MCDVYCVGSPLYYNTSLGLLDYYIAFEGQNVIVSIPFNEV